MGKILNKNRQNCGFFKEALSPPQNSPRGEFLTLSLPLPIPRLHQAKVVIEFILLF